MPSRYLSLLFALCVAVAAGCGGTKKEPAAANNKVADDLDVPKSLKTGPVSKATGPDGGVETTPTNDAGPAAAVDGGATVSANAAFVTFRLQNSTDKDIELNLNRGWSIVVRAYSGDPKQHTAKAIEMFPRFCTAACTAPREDRCPICKRPKVGRKEKEAQKREVIAAGKHLDIPWDGKVFGYKRTRGKHRRRCRCYETTPVPNNTYTVEAFGLHITTSAKKRSVLQKAKAEMIIDGSGKKQVIVLDFKPAPTK